jgi:hypothetical protein
VNFWKPHGTEVLTAMKLCCCVTAGKQDEMSRFTSAYKATQPAPIYAEEEKEDGEDEDRT